MEQESAYCQLTLWNPFPDHPSSNLDISCIFSRLVFLIKRGTSFTEENIRTKIILDIGRYETLADVLHSDVEKLLRLEHLAFLTYNRLQKMHDTQVVAHAPAFSIENIQIEPKYSLEYPQLYAPLLLFEPDRIIYVFYGVNATQEHVFVTCVDSFGEFSHNRWASLPPSAQDLAECVLEIAVALVGNGGFTPRFVICNVNGWNISSFIGIFSFNIRMESGD